MRMRKHAAAAVSARPRPPESLVGVAGALSTCRFLPAPDLADWTAQTFLNEDSPLYNDEHAHLVQATIGFLWAGTPNAKQGRAIVGLAEIPSFQGHRWRREQQEQQVCEWFGHVPDFIITLYADYAAECSDAAFCALVEHELYHCGQERDAFGAPAFKKTGEPKLAMRGHDVEEFVGIVRRYGPGVAAGATEKLVEAARQRPEIAQVDIASVCGTCLLRAA